MTRVEAPSRLHFGLLSLPAGEMERWPDGLPARRFGGVGVMIETPNVQVCAAPAAEWAAEGPSAQRALGFGRTFVRSLGGEERPFALSVEKCPPEHVGLGAGTALALSTAKAIACECGYAGWCSNKLAQRVGRGERSAIGVHGFDLGGLIVDAGKLPGEVLSPLIGRFSWPADWRIVLVRASNDAPWHGPKERQAFGGVQANPTELLCRIVLTALLPALASRDVRSFGEALHEFNVRAGEGFAAVQGGPWAGAEVAGVVAMLREEGACGVGQSSWGPTVFAVVGNEDAASGLKQRLVRRLSISPEAITITRAAQQGAKVQRVKG